MSSEKQIAANQANAQKSTGPRTPEGKARSSKNAVKHGFSSPDFAVIRLEDPRELARIKEDFVRVYQPVNAAELCAIERMAICHQSITRVARLEAGMITACLNETLDAEDCPKLFVNADLLGRGDVEVMKAQNRDLLLGEGFFRRTGKDALSWSLFLRYQAQTERQWRRAVEEFDRVKKLRRELPNEPISDPQPEENKEPDTTPPNPDKPIFPVPLECLVGQRFFEIPRSVRELNPETVLLPQKKE